MKFALRTFGCRANQADSFEIEEALRAGGGVPAGVDDADVVVVNTCTVTGAADRDARNLVRRISARNPAARILVTGCYATRAPGAVAGLPGVVGVVANDGKGGIASAALGAVGRGGRPGSASPGAGLGGPPGSAVPGESADSGAGPSSCLGPGVMGRTAFPLRVQTGCDEACAFCIVPSTRGRSRSRPVADVLADAARLAEAGYKELWVVGVHLGAYGRDLPGSPSLLDLLRALDRAPADLTFRLSSLEPMDCPAGIVDLVAASGRFAPHFHLPLQHADDRVLGAMRRPYTFAACRELVDYVHKALPDAAIGADLVAGFPGESAAEADACAAAVAGLPLTHLHVFPYSDRPGTAAAGMTPKVAPPEVRRRAERLRAIGAALAGRFAQENVGAVRKGLTLDGGTTVLTDNFLKVSIPPGLPRNARVRVRIEADSPRLAGVPVPGRRPPE